MQGKWLSWLQNTAMKTTFVPLIDNSQANYSAKLFLKVSLKPKAAVNENYFFYGCCSIAIALGSIEVD